MQCARWAALDDGLRATPVPISPVLACRASPAPFRNPPICALQMTKGNVGSLLVFDPSKVDLAAEMTKASGDAVVGLITERGTLFSCVINCPALDACGS